MKQLPAVIYKVPQYQNIHLVSEYGSKESFIRNIVLPVLDAKSLGMPVPDEMLMTVLSYLYDFGLRVDADIASSGIEEWMGEVSPIQ